MFKLWEYIAGLFDGDGHFTVGIGKSKGIPYIHYCVGITSCKPETLQPMVDFLKGDGFFQGKTRKGVWRHVSGKTYRFIIAKKQKSEEFIKNIYPYLLIKKEPAKIMLEMLTLHEKIKADKSLKIRNNLHLFNDLRLALHEHSIKGRRAIMLV